MKRSITAYFKPRDKKKTICTNNNPVDVSEGQKDLATSQ